MRKAAKVLGFYLLGLLICSIILSWFKLNNFTLITFIDEKIKIKIITLATVFGGILALKLTVNKKSLKLFLIIYTALWIFRIVVVYVASQIKDVYFLGRILHLDIIITNYYSQVSRLETPIPFVVYWLIKSFFESVKISQEVKEP